MRADKAKITGIKTRSVEHAGFADAGISMAGGAAGQPLAFKRK
jgi:hypothetical protein